MSICDECQKIKLSSDGRTLADEIFAIGELCKTNLYKASEMMTLTMRYASQGGLCSNCSQILYSFNKKIRDALMASL